MKIVKREKEKTVDFVTLKPGDCFRAFDQLYVKSQIDQDATGLENGDARVNMCGIYVVPVNAEVQIID